jgi:hypothetical protein
MKRADQRKHHYIYRIVRHDGKYYIGLHSTDDLDDGYFGSGKLLWRSIKKHGKDKHSKQIVEFLPSRALLKAREAEIVNEELLGDALCLNLKVGGDGGFPPGQSKKNWEDPKYRERVTKAISERMPEVLKRKWSEPEYRAMMTAKSKDYWNDPEYREKCSVGGSYKRSDVHREAQAERCRRQTGENNPCFGTVWITNGTEVKKIKKDQLKTFVDAGFRKGRK